MNAHTDRNLETFGSEQKRRVENARDRDNARKQASTEKLLTAKSRLRASCSAGETKGSSS